MIRHIVMWRIRTDLNQSASSLIQELKSRLEALPSTVSQIKFFEVGVNEKPAPAAYDITLNSSFDSWDDLARYQAHPDHVVVGEFLKGITKERAVVDFES